MKIFRLLTLLIFAALILPAHAFALGGEWQRDDAVNVRLIAGVEGVGTEATIPLGLEIQLAPKWHTYWRSPGAAGLPPQIDWRTSETESGNLQSAALLYPAPKRYTAYGLETIGYTDHVVLPITATLRAPGKPLKLGMALDLLVCSDLCVPKHFVLALDVPEGDATPGAEADLIAPFRAQVPATDSENAGLGLTHIHNDGESLTFHITARTPLEAPDIFLENDQRIEFGAPIVTLADDKLSATLAVKPVMMPEDAALAGLPLTITLTDGAHALEKKIAVPAAPLAHQTAAPAAATNTKNPITAPPAAPALPLAIVILFAIIGGLILNLMPCVLPVLSLKILSVVGHGGGEARAVRQSFLVTAAGIVFSYLALAAATIGLREAGMAVGWGVQFQQPLFLGALVLLLTFFAGNLFGFFEIHLPRFLADNLAEPYHPKLAGDFATGAFATLLATPCTAPFLGTAVGFALAAGWREIMIIFAALGFGMALPYLLIALFPRFATALPRPGAWMIALRQLLGLALAITAGWLMWVLAAQITPRAAMIVACCMMGILGLLALQKMRPGHMYPRFGIISFAVMAFGTMLGGAMVPHQPAAPATDSRWQTFDEAALARDIAAGKTVFVDVTADWCLTCKANKKFVLSREDIAARLFGGDVIAMQADWTNPDEKIAAFLRRYGRYGIPFNAAFGAGAPQGIILPELLTPQAVLDALDKAAKTPQP